MALYLYGVLTGIVVTIGGLWALVAFKEHQIRRALKARRP